MISGFTVVQIVCKECERQYIDLFSGFQSTFTLSYEINDKLKWRGWTMDDETYQCPKCQMTKLEWKVGDLTDDYVYGMNSEPDVR